MTGPLVLFAADPEIARLVKEWQAQAEEAVRVGLRMAQRLVDLERQRDQLRLDNAAQVSELIRLRGELSDARAVVEGTIIALGEQEQVERRGARAASLANDDLLDHRHCGAAGGVRWAAEYLKARLAASDKQTIRKPGGRS